MKMLIKPRPQTSYITVPKHERLRSDPQPGLQERKPRLPLLVPQAGRDRRVEASRMHQQV